MLSFYLFIDLPGSDKIFDPPIPPLTKPWDELKGESEKDAVEALFQKGSLSKDWSVVYRQDVQSATYKVFLCLNWAEHRFKNDLRAGQKFPHEAEASTTDYSVQKMSKELKDDFDLIECKKDDKDRVSSCQSHPCRECHLSSACEDGNNLG